MSGTKSYGHLISRNKKYAKAIVRSKNPSKSLALQVLKDPAAYPWLLKGIGLMLRYEVKKLCSNKVNLIQRSKASGSFPWEDIFEEANVNCPTLTNLLLALTSTKSLRGNRVYLVCAIIRMLYRCSRMSLFQKLISVLLYSGHVGTTVFL